MQGQNPYNILDVQPDHARRVEMWLCERSDGWVCHVPELPDATTERMESEDEAFKLSRHYVCSIVNNMANLKRTIQWKPKPPTPRHVKVKRIRVATITPKDLK